MYDSLRPHGLQHARLPCPSPTPTPIDMSLCTHVNSLFTHVYWVYLLMSICHEFVNSCLLSWWCHPTIYLILCHPLLLPLIFPSIRVFLNESVLCIRWPKYCSFSFSPSNEYPGLISFRMDWLDHLAVHGTLKSLLQHHSSKASILWHSAFFIA